jgi:hypothetical protein
MKDGTININPGMHESWDKDKDGINDCEKDGICDHTIDYSKLRHDDKKVSNFQVPSFYRKLKILEENEILVEVSRELKDCVGVFPKECMQVKEEDGE